MKYVVLDGKRYEWAAIRKVRREQINEARRTKQLQLFEMKTDARPVTQRCASDRYENPMLFEEK